MAMKIKHNKLKNTAIIFECLVKQVTSDFISNDNSKALGIIKTYFKEGTQLKKDLDLYNNIINSKINEEIRFINYMDEILKVRSSVINNSKLNKEKYNVIKEIKESYILENIFSYSLPNYKLFASIFKLFDGLQLNESAKDFVNLKFSIIKSILNNKKIDNPSTNVKLLESIKEPTTKDLTIKLLVEKFNKKFSNRLTTDQKKLVKEYINNAENKNTLNNYITSIIPIIKKKLSEASKSHNKITKIKVKEVIQLLESLNKIKNIKDDHIISILKTYQLINELKKNEKRRS